MLALSPVLVLIATLAQGASVPVRPVPRHCIGRADACSRSADCITTDLCGAGSSARAGLAAFRLGRRVKYAPQDDGFGSDGGDSFDVDFNSGDDSSVGPEFEDDGSADDNSGGSGGAVDSLSDWRGGIDDPTGDDARGDLRDGTDHAGSDYSLNAGDNALAGGSDEADSSFAVDLRNTTAFGSEELVVANPPNPVISLITQCEPFVVSPIPDPSSVSPFGVGFGRETVGFGHKCTFPSCADVTHAGFRFPLNPQSTGLQLLVNDVRLFTYCVNFAVRVPLNANQRAALTSLALSLGPDCGGLSTSRLVRRLNSGQDPNTVARSEFPALNKVRVAGGRASPDATLTRRRGAELALFTAVQPLTLQNCVPVTARTTFV